MALTRRFRRVAVEPQVRIFRLDLLQSICFVGVSKVEAFSSASIPIGRQLSHDDALRLSLSVQCPMMLEKEHCRLLLESKRLQIGRRF